MCNKSAHMPLSYGIEMSQDPDTHVVPMGLTNLTSMIFYKHVVPTGLNRRTILTHPLPVAINYF
jgi:hypothetical protein